MITEADHDELIAPQLLKAMKDTAEHGGSLLAYSSFMQEDGELGFTRTCHSPEPNIHAGTIDASASIFLSPYLGGSAD